MGSPSSGTTGTLNRRDQFGLRTMGCGSTHPADLVRACESQFTQKTGPILTSGRSRKCEILPVLLQIYCFTQGSDKLANSDIVNWSFPSNVEAGVRDKVRSGY